MWLDTFLLHRPFTKNLCWLLAHGVGADGPYYCHDHQVRPLVKEHRVMNKTLISSEILGTCRGFLPQLRNPVLNCEIYCGFIYRKGIIFDYNTVWFCVLGWWNADVSSVVSTGLLKRARLSSTAISWFGPHTSMSFRTSNSPISSYTIHR